MKSYSKTFLWNYLQVSIQDATYLRIIFSSKDKQIFKIFLYLKLYILRSFTVVFKRKVLKAFMDTLLKKMC